MPNILLTAIIISCRRNLGLRKVILFRSLNMILVLFATLLVTILLLGPTLDKILLENIRTQVVDEVNEKIGRAHV